MEDDNTPEFVMIPEDEFDDMCADISFWSASVDMLTEVLVEHGIDIIITEEQIWERVRQNEAPDPGVN